MSEQNPNNKPSVSYADPNKTEVVLENTLLKRTFKKKLKKKTIIIIAIILTAMAVFAGKMLSDSSTTKLPVSVYTVEPGTIEQRISVNGIVGGSDSAEISSTLSFEFISINVKEGDLVKKGDILGVLDNKTLQSDYDMALKDVEIAKKQIEEQRSSAKLAVDERQIDYNEAKRQNDIAKELFDQGAISNDEMVQSKIMLEKSEFALAAAKDALEKASDSGTAALGLQIKQELLATKKDNLSKANIKSPINGTVTRVNAKIGRIATAQDQMKPLFIVENLNDLIINVTISEYDISNVQVGQTVRITSDVLGLGNAIEGKVSRIAPTGESVVGATTKEMRIPVEIKVTDADNKMIAGVNAKVDILIAKRENVLNVPLEAIVDESGEKSVLLANDNVIKKISVVTGLESITNVEIASDILTPGDKIVLNPTVDLIDGTEIMVVE